MALLKINKRQKNINLQKTTKYPKHLGNIQKFAVYPKLNFVMHHLFG